ncbi:MAG: hypothetical protein WC382_11325 [Methanoregulaceae archaeon]|jgi:hypothetical protein
MRELAFEQEKSAIGLVRIERKRWKHYKGTGKLAKDIRKAKGESGETGSEQECVSESRAHRALKRILQRLYKYILCCKET